MKIKICHKLTKRSKSARTDIFSIQRRHRVDSLRQYGYLGQFGFTNNGTQKRSLSLITLNQNKFGRSVCEGNCYDQPGQAPTTSQVGPNASFRICEMCQLQ